jgi:U4/U6.U5 tri-snRNP-associated protein 2
MYTHVSHVVDFFQGRGKNSIAYAHALDVELNHHIFINLTTEEIYCLPDGYQVFDPSLDDIKFNLHPKFKQSDLDRLDKDTAFIHALDGTDYLPGLVGLNNIKNTDWLNVIIQALNFIPSLRNFFIVDQSWDRSLKALPSTTTATATSGKLLLSQMLLLHPLNLLLPLPPTLSPNPVRSP